MLDISSSYNGFDVGPVVVEKYRDHMDGMNVNSEARAGVSSVTYTTKKFYSIEY